MITTLKCLDGMFATDYDASWDGLLCCLVQKIVFSYTRRTQFPIRNSAGTILWDGLGMFNFAFMLDVGMGCVSLDPYTLFNLDAWPANRTSFRDHLNNYEEVKARFHRSVTT